GAGATDGAGVTARTAGTTERGTSASRLRPNHGKRRRRTWRMAISDPRRSVAPVPHPVPFLPCRRYVPISVGVPRHLSLRSHCVVDSRTSRFRGRPVLPAPVPNQLHKRCNFRMFEAMQILRTPDDRFVDLPGYAYEPHYVEVAAGDGSGDTIRVHYIDERGAGAASG